jgi:hypothetical protein
MSGLVSTALALFKTKRKIGSFTAQVTITEEHTDELTVTDHPVEKGAVISDHAYKNPARLNVTVGWSNSGAQGAVGTATSAISDLLSGNILGAISDVVSGGYVRTVYQNFLDLMATREPFSVMTGKRNYKNMVITSISTTTDKETENSLVLNVGMREVIIVQTQAVTLSDAANMLSPAGISATINAGVKQLVPAKVSNAVSVAKSVSNFVFGK